MESSSLTFVYFVIFLVYFLDKCWLFASIICCSTILIVATCACEEGSLLQIEIERSKEIRHEYVSVIRLKFNLEIA